MKKILLADDSPIVRNLIKTILVQHYELIEAENGQTAIDKANENNVDLILLDLNMPVIDGLEATRKIRSIPKYAKIPILILTSEIKEEKKQQGKESGATGWILKTCDPNELINTIKKLLQ